MVEKGIRQHGRNVGYPCRQAERQRRNQESPALDQQQLVERIVRGEVPGGAQEVDAGRRISLMVAGNIIDRKLILRALITHWR